MSTKTLSNATGLVTVCGEKPGESLLSKIDTIDIPEIREFTPDKEFLRKSNILEVGNNFLDLFYGQKQEGNSGGSIALHKLNKNALEIHIFAELGAKALIKLGQLIWLVGQQSVGQEGRLLVNGRTNIGFVMKDGIVHSIATCWLKPALQNPPFWHKDANVGIKNEWTKGTRVISLG